MMELSEYLLKEYRERIEVLTYALASNQARSFEEVQYTCGQIRGLESACFVIKDLNRQLENSDNE